MAKLPSADKSELARCILLAGVIPIIVFVAFTLFRHYVFGSDGITAGVVITISVIALVWFVTITFLGVRRINKKYKF